MRKIEKLFPPKAGKQKTAQFLVILSEIVSLAISRDIAIATVEVKHRHTPADVEI